MHVVVVVVGVVAIVVAIFVVVVVVVVIVAVKVDVAFAVVVVTVAVAVAAVVAVGGSRAPVRWRAPARACPRESGHVFYIYQLPIDRLCGCYVNQLTVRWYSAHWVDVEPKDDWLVGLLRVTVVGSACVSERRSPPWNIDSKVTMSN